MKNLPTLSTLLISVGAYAAFVCTLLSSLIFYATFATHEPPAVFSSPAETTAWQGVGSTVVRHKREMIATDSAPLTVTRCISCMIGASEQLFELPTVTYSLDKGKSRVIPLVASLPFNLQSGTLCELRTTVTWSPTFALKTFTKHLPPEQFVVGDTR